MPLSRPPHAAIEGVESILRQLCPRAFAYRLEAGDGGWTLLVERATDEGWRAHAVAVDPTELSSSLCDAELRDRLTVAWARRLGTSRSIAAVPHPGAPRLHPAPSQTSGQ